VVSLIFGKLLGIGEPIEQTIMIFDEAAGKNDGTCDDGTCEGTSTSFIQTCDALVTSVPSLKLVLKH